MVADPTNLQGKLVPYTFLDSDGIPGGSRNALIVGSTPDVFGPGSPGYSVTIFLDLSNPADVTLGAGSDRVQRYGVAFSRDPLPGTIGVYPF
jgi:hypothetical protein